MDRCVDQFLNSLSAHVDLGHSKRNQSFLRQISSYCIGKPEHVNPRQANSPFADVMSSYRFCRNEEISSSALRKIRLKSMLSSWAAKETMLLINDVSILDYYRHNSKIDRRDVGDGKGKGYEYVCNLAISLERECVVGVAHDCLIDESGPDDGDIIDYHADVPFQHFPPTEQQRLECNHKHQLLCHFRYIHRQRPGVRKIVVADREFDDHYFFQGCMVEGENFVIRSNALRNVQIPLYDWFPKEAHAPHYQGLPCTEGYCCADMRELVQYVPLRPYKALPLDGKGRHTDANTASSWANLSMGACKIRLYRQFKRNKLYFPPTEYVDLNLVVIRETQPSQGRDPICWVLLTSLPVTTWEEMLKIARIYELRWLIECFFKLLKSGYRIEELRVDSSEKVAKHLVCITIAATFILNLKQAAGIPNAARLDGKTYEEIKNAGRHPNDESISLQMRIFAYIALAGGWLGRRNDPISTITLMRGFRILMQNLESLRTAMDFLTETGQIFKKQNAYDR